MASPNLITVTAANFEQEVLKSAQPVLVDFWAEWCGPCKMVSPILDELAVEYGGRAQIAKVNVDEHQELAVQCRINSIPTIPFFKNVQIVDQIVGMKSKKDLKAKLDQLAA